MSPLIIDRSSVHMHSSVWVLDKRDEQALAKQVSKYGESHGRDAYAQAVAPGAAPPQESASTPASTLGCSCQTQRKFDERIQKKNQLTGSTRQWASFDIYSTRSEETGYEVTPPRARPPRARRDDRMPSGERSSFRALDPGTCTQYTGRSKCIRV